MHILASCRFGWFTGCKYFMTFLTHVFHIPGPRKFFNFFRCSCCAFPYCPSTRTKKIQEKLFFVKVRSNGNPKSKTYQTSSDFLPGLISLKPAGNSSSLCWHGHLAIGIHSPFEFKVSPSGQLQPSTQVILHCPNPSNEISSQDL